MKEFEFELSPKEMALLLTNMKLAQELLTLDDETLPLADRTDSLVDKMISQTPESFRVFIRGTVNNYKPMIQPAAPRFAVTDEQIREWIKEQDDTERQNNIGEW